MKQQTSAVVAKSTRDSNGRQFVYYADKSYSLISKDNKVLFTTKETQES